MSSVTSLDLRHYSHDSIEAVRDAEQRFDRLFKPEGLWLSVEDGNGWAEWCEENDFSGSWTHVYRVTLNPRANILWLRSVRDIDNFTRDFAVTDPARLYGRGDQIMWVAVAQCYDGIIVAPYQWERRLHSTTGWYYSWDCASGCVWNANAVANLRLVT